MKLVLLLCVFCSAVSFAQDYGRGLIKPENSEKMGVFLSPTLIEDGLPEEYDLREKKMVSPIRNQGGCGSCWAFGTLDAFESNALVQGVGAFFLSTQQLVNCQYYGCGGGYFAFDYVQKKGVTTAEEFPYKGSDGKCKENFTKKYFASDWYRIGSPNKSPTVEEVKTAIYKYGAVAITVAADNSWNNYKGGVKKSCQKGQTNHIVTLVGWQKDDVMILKNSWSKNWGDQGYGYFPFSCNRAGSDEAAVGVFKNESLQKAAAQLRSSEGSGVIEISTDAGVLSVLK